MKMSDPGDLASQNDSVTVFSEFYIPDSFKTAGWVGPASQTTLARTLTKPYVIPSHQDLTIILIFQASLKMVVPID